MVGNFITTILLESNLSSADMPIASPLMIAVSEELLRKDACVRQRLVGLHIVYPKHEEFMAKIAEVDAASLAKALERRVTLRKQFLIVLEKERSQLNI